MIVSLPGVYRPQDDTSLLIEALKCQRVTGSTRVLDLCAGTGALSIAAAKAGAGRVLAVDISRRSIVNVRLNRLLNKVSVEARRGDLTEVLTGEMFDLVVSNPPYVPSEIDELPASGLERAWNGGTGGRVLLDRIIASASDFLAPGGSLLLLQSAMCDIGKTGAMLKERGMTAEVVAGRSIPFGPVLRSRRAMLERRGLIEHGQEIEELVVVRASKPLPMVRGKRSDGLGSRTGMTGGNPRKKEEAVSNPRSLVLEETERAASQGDDGDVTEHLRRMLIGVGFRITHTVTTRTATDIESVLTLAPKGCVLIRTDSYTGVTEVMLQIEHVGREVAAYLRNQLPKNILREAKISVESNRLQNRAAQIR